MPGSMKSTALFSPMQPIAGRRDWVVNGGSRVDVQESWCAEGRDQMIVLDTDTFSFLELPDSPEYARLRAQDRAVRSA